MPSLTCVKADIPNQVQNKLWNTTTTSLIEGRLECLIRDLEETSINNNTQENRMNLSKAKAEYTTFLKIQEKVLSQKARIKKF